MYPQFKKKEKKKIIAKDAHLEQMKDSLKDRK